MKILVAEDDKNTFLFLQKGLTENGFVVDQAADGETAIHLLSSTEFDIVILDVMLPEKDGWEVLEDLRKRGKSTPVIFLTARDKVEDRLKGFDLGADDYLVKPFAFSELLARLRALLRRSASHRSDTLRIADLEIDLLRHKATRGGKQIDLRPKEFALLSLLARRAGETLSRTYIAEQVWEMNFQGETNVVDVHIRRLRISVDEPLLSGLRP
ncbi:MAG: heavy metal response regulator transcription factor [Candidatus Riflebacteria bacterium]|nr:heavy metal response regulator transcription factor [Candidatus Riflebacteria bacterium]